ncbi:MAG TPA: hypothetical protein VHU91_05420 [Mycobacteriales bacterium]|jgi:hypothetical protein|nr:hypothetical protein [Mycobacteriales bacterium]
MTTTRKPAITRTVSHPADAIPERPAATHQPQPPAPAAAGEEKLSEQHNVRIRPSVKTRLTKAVDKLRYETGDRSISIASVTDQAIDEYLKQRSC